MAHNPVPSDPRYDPHFAAVGRLVETWAQLEFHIDQAIWELAAVEQMFGACITAQFIGINGRLKALHALLEVHGLSEAKLKELGTFEGSLGGLQNERHRAAHDPRMVNRATGQMDRLQITASHSLVFGFQPESVESLNETRQKIMGKVEEFKRLFLAIANELNALPDKDRPILKRIVPVKEAQEAPAIGS